MVQMLHNQLSVNVGLNELGEYRPDFKSAGWSDQRWRELLLLQLRLDQGSDVVSALNAMQFKPDLKLNVGVV